MEIVYSPIKSLVPELAEAENTLLSPAARQMLYLHAYPGQSLHDDFYAELAAKGTPQDFEMVGILNGAQTGTPQLFAPGDLLVELEANLGDYISDEIGGLSIWGDAAAFLVTVILGTDATVDFEIHALPDNPSSFEEIYEGKIHIKIFHVIGKVEYRKVLIKENVAWDSAPGGMFGEVLPSEVQDLIDDGFLTVNANSFCFVPSISSADIDPAISNNDPFFPLNDVAANVTSGATDFRAYAGSTMNNTSYGINQRNQPHVEYTTEGAAFFLSEMAAAFRLTQNPLTQTYNYGESDINPTIPNPFVKTPNKISEDLTVSNGGKLWVNRYDKIGFVNNLANPENGESTHFDLYTQLDHCNAENESLLINIANNSEIILGDWTGASGNTATLHLGNGTNLLIQNGGLLEIDNKSKLIIQSGAEVIIESGGLLKSTWGSQVIVEAGGVLEIRGEGILRPMHYSQVWVQPGGQLIVNDGAIFQMWDGQDMDGACNVKFGGIVLDPDNTPEVAELVIRGAFEWGGNGYLDIHPNSEVELVGAADFAISGLGKGYRFLKLSDGARLDINKNQCVLSNGKMEYSEGSAIVLGTEAAGKFSKMELAGSENSVGVFGKGCRFIFVTNSSFTDFLEGIHAVELTELYLNENVFVFESDFTDCNVGIVANELENIRIWNSRIQTNAEGYKGIGVHLTNVNNGYLVSSRIQNCDDGIEMYGATDFVMNGGNIKDCRFGINLLDAPSESLTNSTIDLIGQATLENNFTGIFGLKDSEFDAPIITPGENVPFPMITLDCARFIENIIGIRGRDLLLNIDGGSDTAPNVFIENPNFSKSRIFELCYDKLNVITVEATNNYWGSPNPFIERRIINSGGQHLDFCALMSDTQGYDDLATNTAGTGNVTLAFSPVLTTEPTGCSGPGDPGGPIGTGGDDKIFTPLIPTVDFQNKVANCEYSYNDEEKFVYDTYWAAHSLYLSEVEMYSNDHTASRSEFEKIAILTNQQTANYSHTCKMLVRKAQSRTGYTTSLGSLSQGINSGINNAISQELIIAPNPAQNSFTLNFIEEAAQLRIYNRLGQKVFQQKVSYQIVVNTKEWQSGIYIVEILDTETNQRKRGKVVVNR